MISDQSRVADLLLDWEEAGRTGRSVTPEELCADCPELLPAVKKGINRLRAMNQRLAGRSHTPTDHDTASNVGPAEELPETVNFGEGESREESPRFPSHPVQFGDYELLEEIARGGMGVVYKARQISLNRIVALKMILSGQFAGKTEIQRFRVEAEAAAQLEHPGIVPIHEVGEYQGHHFINMGYIEGNSLSVPLQKGPLEPRHAAEMVRQIAEAVAYAHSRGIVHRDLKPGNVLVDRTGRAKVSDFGLAKSVESDSGLTIHGQILGTPSYMPPEQAKGDPTGIGPSADIYSLGATLYALLTARPPFRAATKLETLAQVIANDPVSPRQLNPAVSRDLDTICMKCLRKEPQARYATAQELVEDLSRWLNNQPILARPVSVWEKAWLWCRRSPLLAGSILAILLTVSAASGVVIHQQQVNAQQMAATRRENDRQRAISHVDNALTAPPAGFPFAMQLIEPLAEHALSVAQDRFDDPHGSESQRLHAALVLAGLGDVRTEFLIDSIPHVQHEECRNLVRALKQSEKALLLIHHRVAQLRTTAQPDRSHQARLAIVALHLGDPSLAEELVLPRADLTPRTVLVNTLPEWHGDIGELADQVSASRNIPLQSAIVAGVGQIPAAEILPEQLQQWESVLTNLYTQSPDSLMHTTAGWALRQWNLELPTLPVSADPAPGMNWYVNREGMTMLAIPAGRFPRTVNVPGSPTAEKPVEITLTRPFFIADREVSVGLFQQFLDDPAYPATEKPQSWPGADRTISPTSAHPVQSVNWEEAVLFCNWLSQREGLSPCYRREGEGWIWQQEANGYRLPTEAEWEYAYRAQTATRYPTGETELNLDRYAVYRTEITQPCATRLPHGFGTFDMAGNVSEWCFDFYQPHSDLELIDPVGPAQGRTRTIRGGTFKQGLRGMQVGHRMGTHPLGWDDSIGFRLAR